MQERIDLLVDIPFAYRHTCWFCGEPSDQFVTFPHTRHIVLSCPHPQLTLPSCRECRPFAYQAKVNHVWAVRASVKKSLIHKYRKDLAIGLNWTQEELANAGFEGGNFESFQRSAWFMYEVARDRVNFQAWPLSQGGVDIDDDIEPITFEFDGVVYPSIDDAIKHYSGNFRFNRQILVKTLAILGTSQFAKAVRFCRLLIGATPNEVNSALAELKAQQVNR
ncbi:hypothetical protein DXX93_13310 [Thalassotalea euphylliae]|uniref:Uncharacterized protein n=1 Tax=Thalassotalea euphylliae TaxID=1655234 RepID=A0A3E0TU51_9GAMM|nr:hypothetical protein [Thalassotalea euphylliae]REL27445.1 hypothetical protein DXX93_13310 [Thalassotalea euphylliae]